PRRSVITSDLGEPGRMPATPGTRRAFCARRASAAWARIRSSVRARAGRRPSRRARTSLRSAAMLEVPKTCYAAVGRDHVAYQVLGEGPPDLVFVPHWNTNVEALWDFPQLAHFVRQLARFGRVVVFDKRGTGLSDGLSARGQPLLEQFADDLRAVLD